MPAQALVARLVRCSFAVGKVSYEITALRGRRYASAWVGLSVSSWRWRPASTT